MSSTPPFLHSLALFHRPAILKILKPEDKPVFFMGSCLALYILMFNLSGSPDYKYSKRLKKSPDRVTVAA
jgi:hypothetical protein